MTLARLPALLRRSREEFAPIMQLAESAHRVGIVLGLGVPVAEAGSEAEVWARACAATAGRPR